MLKDMEVAVKSKGKLMPDDKAIIIEDLISTGGSSLECSEALRSEGHRSNRNCFDLYI